MVIESVANNTYILRCPNGYTFTGTYQECRWKADEILSGKEPV